MADHYKEAPEKALRDAAVALEEGAAIDALLVPQMGAWNQEQATVLKKMRNEFQVPNTVRE